MGDIVVLKKKTDVKKKRKREQYQTYKLVVDNVPCTVNIYKDPKKFIPTYELLFPQADVATGVVLDSIKQMLVQKVKIKLSEILDPKSIQSIKQKFAEEAIEEISREFPQLLEEDQLSLAGMLLHDMLGLGVDQRGRRTLGHLPQQVGNESEILFNFR